MFKTIQTLFCSCLFFFYVDKSVGKIFNPNIYFRDDDKVACFAHGAYTVDKHFIFIFYMEQLHIQIYNKQS